MIRLAEQLQVLNEKRTDFVLVTLTGIKGSAPQIEGAKMLVTTDGLFWGTVGGGKIEAHCIVWAKKMIQDKASPQLQNWNLQKDIGMSCGGEASFFFDIQLHSQSNIAIFGAGHISQELTRILTTWNCNVSVFDTRAEWIEKLPKSPNVIAKRSENLAAEVAHLPEKTFLLCMTQGHASDVPVLREAMRDIKKFAMLGVIGSDVKAIKIKKELRELGVLESDIARLQCPMGLPIGSNTPSEIAISVCAQVLAIRDKVSFKLHEGLIQTSATYY